MKIVRTLLTVGAAATLTVAAAFPAFAGPGSYTTRGYIIGNQPGSRVNVRTAPSVDSSAPSYGLVGDRVRIITGTVGEDSDYWYLVEFPSGTRGWIRADFIYEEYAH